MVKNLRSEVMRSQLTVRVSTGAANLAKIFHPFGMSVRALSVMVASKLLSQYALNTIFPSNTGSTAGAAESPYQSAVPIGWLPLYLQNQVKFLFNIVSRR